LRRAPFFFSAPPAHKQKNNDNDENQGYSVKYLPSKHIFS